MKNEGIVYVNDEMVGTIKYEGKLYTFRYNDDYFNNLSKKAISVTLSKKKQKHTSKILFPFFFNMLSEGVNRELQCRQLKIDREDYFGLLLATGNKETIGAVYVKESDEN